MMTSASALGNAQGGLEDLLHGEVDPADDQAVHEDAEVQCPEATQKSGRLACITQLDELRIGNDFRAPPQAGKEEDGHHAVEKKAPPEPVAGNSLSRHQACDRQRSVGGKGRGHHGRTRQPPGDLPAGNKKVARAGACLLAIVEPNQQIDREIRGHD